MYPSSSSSSSQGSMGPSGLIRYGSAPGSFLSNAVDSVIGGSTRDLSTVGSQQPHLVATNYFSACAGDTSSITSESNCKANPPPPPNPDTKDTNKLLPLHRSYGFGDFATANVNLNSKNGGGGSLVRHSSSPAGFLNHLTVNASATAATPDNGFSVTRGIGSYNSKGVSDSSQGISRLASQLSFTRRDSLSHISEESENIADGISTDNGNRKAAHSYATSSFGMGSWDESNAFVFSDSRIKRAKCISSDTHCLNTVESQLQFSLPQTALEMETMENILQMSQDSVPCKIRAKRGCATHPRSIAERDRRTRINGKLKKLQELVPNLDKQTSYADMLDLAVQHIKGLQNQVQKLNKELENCSCGCKQAV